MWRPHANIYTHTLEEHEYQELFKRMTRQVRQLNFIKHEKWEWSHQGETGVAFYNK